MPGSVKRFNILKNKIVPIVSLALLFFAASFFTYSYRIYKNIHVETVNVGEVQRQTPTPPPDPMAPRNILILGYGGVGHDGGDLTDTMILAHIIPRQNL